MSEIDRSIDMIQRDLLLARQGLRAEQIENLTKTLGELRKERWRQFSEGLEIDKRFYEAHKPKPLPETCLVPRSADEWIDGHGHWHRQDCESRKDL